MSSPDQFSDPRLSGHETVGHKTLGAQQARQGITLGSVRYVLGFSLVLAVIAGIVLYAVFFL